MLPGRSPYLLLDFWYLGDPLPEAQPGVANKASLFEAKAQASTQRSLDTGDGAKPSPQEERGGDCARREAAPGKR